MIRVTVTVDGEPFVEDFDGWDQAFAFVKMEALSDAVVFARDGLVPWKTKSFDIAQVPS